MKHMNKMAQKLLFLCVLCAAPVHAQEEPEQTTPELQAEIEKLEQQIAELEESKAAREAVEETNARVEDFVFERAMAAVEKEVAETARSDFFQFYGFFDLTYNHWFMKKGTPAALFLSPIPSFFITNSNINFKSQMTKTLSGHLELRLSFLPHGNDTGYEYHIYEQNEQGAWEQTMSQGEYTRLSTEVQDRFTTMYFRQGGVMIERIQLTYEPKEWLKVIAGRFLTPYGIWIVEHDTTGVIHVRVPYMQLREMVPREQTGLQVFGRVFFGRSDLFLDYAVTVSNGHGPIEQVHDLDANKALGLKLKGTYSSPNFKISLGGYGMYGKYTDIKKVVNIYTTEEGKLAKDDADMPLQVDVVNVKSMDEMIVALDFLMQWHGLRLQSEFVWTRWDYNKTGPRSDEETLIAGGSPENGAEMFRASNVGTGAYLLLAYELPLARWIGDVKITPYGIYEYNRHDDTLPHAWIDALAVGLNVKPSAFLALKLEFAVIKPELAMFGGQFQSLSAQMAVSF